MAFPVDGSTTHRYISALKIDRQGAVVTNDPKDYEDINISSLQQWLAQEIKDLDKARELRIKEATGIAEAFSKGEINSEQAADKLNDYEDRWGLALRGAFALPHLTDEEIIANIDKRRADSAAKKEERERRTAYLERTGLPPTGKTR